MPEMFRIATWNVNSLRVRLPQVLDWLAANPVDALALQETKLPDPDFPQAGIEQAGYRSLFAGQPTYNGVALLYRGEPFRCIATGLPDHDDPQRRVLCAVRGNLCLLNVYVPNGAAVGSDKYAYKLDWLARLRDYIRQLLGEYRQVVVLGDFNIAPEDRDVHDPEAWRDQVLFSEPEKAGFRALLELGLKDCYRLFEQPEADFTWWDYRAAAFRRNLGLRIDHILADPGLAETCTACFIDKAPRRKERPSDHAPVVAEFSAKS